MGFLLRFRPYPLRHMTLNVTFKNDRNSLSCHGEAVAEDATTGCSLRQARFMMGWRTGKIRSSKALSLIAFASVSVLNNSLDKQRKRTLEGWRDIRVSVNNVTCFIMIKLIIV